MNWYDLKLSYKDLKLECGWVVMVVIGLFATILLSVCLCWVSHNRDLIVPILNRMCRLERSALGENGLPVTEGTYAFLHMNGEVQLYEVKWTDGEEKPLAKNCRPLRKFSDMEGKWLGKVLT